MLVGVAENACSLTLELGLVQIVVRAGRFQYLFLAGPTNSAYQLAYVITVYGHWSAMARVDSSAEYSN